MGRRYQYFSVTGSANTTVLDTGITSTQETKYHLVGMLVYVSGRAGNRVKVKLERTDLVDIPDYLIATDESTGSTNVQKASVAICEVPMGMDVPVGQAIQAGIKCGATAKNLFGAYIYEVK